MGKGRAGTRTRTKERRGGTRKASHGPAAGDWGKPEAAPAPLPAGAEPAWRGPAKTLTTCPVAVRASTPADAPAIASLWAELSRLHASLGEEWEVAAGSAERYARSVAAAAENPRLIFLVAEMEIDGAWRMTGFIHAAVKLRSSVFRESVVGEISAICVAPVASGRGVGSALVAAAMDWFRKRDIAHVEAVMSAGNTPARAFWRAMGFRESASIMWGDTPPKCGPSSEAEGAEDTARPNPGTGLPSAL